MSIACTLHPSTHESAWFSVPSRRPSQPRQTQALISTATTPVACWRRTKQTTLPQPSRQSRGPKALAQGWEAVQSMRRACATRRTQQGERSCSPSCPPPSSKSQHSELLRCTVPGMAHSAKGCSPLCSRIGAIGRRTRMRGEPHEPAHYVSGGFVAECRGFVAESSFSRFGAN